MRYSIIHHDVREQFQLTISQYLVADSIHQLSRKGVCKMADQKLSEFIGVSREHVSRSRSELIEKGLVEKIDSGYMTTQKWYEAVTFKDVTKYHKDEEMRQNVTTMRQNVTTDNIYKDNITSVANAPRIEIVSREEEENPKSQPKPKYPNSRQVFGWFPAVEPSWQINTTECKHAELLYIRGESAVKAIMKFCAKHESDEFFPKWRKPSSLERNWPEIQDFAKRNGL